MSYSQPPGGQSPRLGGYRPSDEQTRPLSSRIARPPPRPPERPGTSPLMLGLVYGGIGLLAVAAAAVTFLIVAPPSDLIREQIVTRVKAATGRDLQIAGPASFTFYPVLGIRLNDVSLSGPPGTAGGPMATLSSLDVGVRILPLLSKEVVVDRLVLYKPVFDLRVDRNGRKNWEMTVREDARPVRLALARKVRATVTDAADEMQIAFTDALAQPVAPASRGSGVEMSNLVLDDIRLVDGMIRYTDEQAGSTYEVGAINAKLALPSITQPLEAKGDLKWAGETINFDGRLTSPRELMEEQPAKLLANVSGRPITLKYDGSVLLKTSLDLDGAVDGKADSLRTLAAWLGTELPPARGFGALSLSGRLKATSAAVRLSQANLALDGATATGTVAVDTSKARPHIVADLKVADLNLGNYVSDGESSGREAPAAKTTPGARSPGKTSDEPPQSIEDLLNRPGPKVKGYTKRAGWSQEPIDLSTLGAFDADANMSVVRLGYDNIRMDSANLVIAIKDQVLKTSFEDVKLYKGRGKGLVTLDGRGKAAVLAANLSINGVEAQPLLKDAVEMDWLAGTGNLTMSVSGSGRSQADIVGSLNGKSNLAVANGAIIGFNLAGALRALSSGGIPNLSTSPTEKTDFSELTASFDVVNGVAKNEDMVLSSPLLRATGSGTIQLAKRQIDYTLQPKLVASLQGQGGEKGASGLSIPIRIHGSWDDPSIAADIAGVLNNPSTVEAVKEIGKQLKGKNAGEIVDDLFGQSKEGEPSKAQKLFDQFLGR